MRASLSPCRCAAAGTVAIQNTDSPVNFIIHRSDEKDPGPDQSFDPSSQASAWIQSGDATVYDDRGGGAAEQYATIHYRRPAGDYGDFTSSNYLDFWGLHTWEGAPDPGWTTPRKPVAQDGFGLVFEVPLLPDADWMGYLLHRGDEKDPGPDQILDFGELWMSRDELPVPLGLDIVRRDLGDDLMRAISKGFRDSIVAAHDHEDAASSFRAVQ